MAGDPSERDEALDALRDQLSELLAAQRRLRGRDAGQNRGGLSFAQFRLVRELGRAEGSALPASQLAAAAELAPPTVTQMLDQLAAAGLVERTRSERDRRVVTNRLTDEGRRVLDEKEALHARKWRGAFADLDRDALDAGSAVLARLRRLYDDL
ncbi:MarR family winged helix-turn-helix transcriptional regulator [Conexibacter woesei]|uniref:Transcriptional regulator, MarR family n=1 Tax=Conexibacter woesei (strain DSM 14684 / CCUG 47730 / CIP 108061 / JCM 11494 / NBRC 100937 / ID131577) TaxID=469383 RepID=D3FEJ8_CONWI|nr:MarR family transcriptional regulator [Conexibacter woesei]ADB49672.1 transcriptional regulator, MarR family [Conexibacter woesei DSM 14684]